MHVWGTGASIAPHISGMSSTCYISRLSKVLQSNRSPASARWHPAAARTRSMLRLNSSTVECILEQSVEHVLLRLFVTVPCGHSASGPEEPGCPNREGHWQYPTRWPVSCLLAVSNTS